MPSRSGAASDPGAPVEHAARNRAIWDDYSDEYQARHGEDLAESGGLAWGTARIPRSELRVLGDFGRDILEFGCSAARWSITLARLARPPGWAGPVATSARARPPLMAAAGVDFPLVHASAEAVPLPAASFDVVFCDTRR